MPLERKDIVGKADMISFDRAWKNGVWHAYEPLSLDLADADGIKGQGAALAWTPISGGRWVVGPFQGLFHTWKAKAETLIPAYENAKAILARAPGQPAIYEENQIDGLVTEIEDEYRVHVTTGR